MYHVHSLPFGASHEDIAVMFRSILCLSHYLVTLHIQKMRL